MEKHNKDLEMTKIVIYFLQVTLMQTYANYWKLKSKKDSPNVEYNKIKKDYKYGVDSFEATERAEELKEDIGNVYQSKNEI